MLSLGTWFVENRIIVHSMRRAGMIVHVIVGTHFPHRRNADIARDRRRAHPAPRGEKDASKQ
jgi:hypothetical protein